MTKFIINNINNFLINSINSKKIKNGAMPSTRLQGLLFSTKTTTSSRKLSNKKKSTSSTLDDNNVEDEIEYDTALISAKIKSLVESRLLSENNKIVESLTAETRDRVNIYKNLNKAGVVVRVDDSIVTVVGLRSACVGSVVRFVETRVKGIVLSIERKGLLKIALFAYRAKMHDIVILEDSGDKPTTLSLFCTRLKKGHVIDTLGNVIDEEDKSIEKLQCGLSLLNESDSYYEDKIDQLIKEFPEYNSLYYNDFNKIADVSAPSIMNRSKVSDPLYTGTTLVDILLPIGKGQRQLIIGDRQTGKTTIAVDMIINQNNLSKDFGYFGNCETTSIYVSIGQRRSEVSSIFKTLKFLNASEFSVIVTSSASEPCTLQYLAAYTGCTLAEFFRDSGQNSVVVYDDLTKHAVAYRQMCLLLRRSPGRDAYPSDIFYSHSRLLERAASTRVGTLTALPIIETQANDVSSYIPTNVISITDGQIFLEGALFSKGIKPAVNLGLSVSRIGAAAQNAVFRKLAPSLRKQLALFRTFEIFKSFSDDISPTVKNILSRGDALTEITKQQPNAPIGFDTQGVLVYAGTTGLLDSVISEEIPTFKEVLFDDSVTGKVKVSFFDQMLLNKPLYDNSSNDVSFYVDSAVSSADFVNSYNTKLYSSASKVKKARLFA